MGYIKGLRVKMLLGHILLTGVGLLLNNIFFRENILFFLLAAEFLLFYVASVWLMKPWDIFEKKLRELAKAPVEDKEKAFPPKTIYMDEIKALIDFYVTVQTKYNMRKIQDKQTELNALQSQINPHFLYNTLESIRGQALVDGNDEIAEMVEALAMFFRYSISGKGNLVPLRDELASINNYITIQRYRFNNRFSLEILIEEEDKVAYDYLVPRLIIQPIVENAIFHGLEEMEQGGRVIVELLLTDQNLMITVSDNGKGMSKEQLEKINRALKSAPYAEEKEQAPEEGKKKGIALSNINKRIRLLFGENYGLHIYSTLGQGTDVELHMPIKQTS